MKVELYTRVEHCPFCLNAKLLLNERGIPYSEISAGRDCTKEELVDAVFKRCGVRVSTVPAVFIDDEFIGGFTEMRSWFLEKESSDETPEQIDLSDFDL